MSKKHDKLTPLKRHHLKLSKEQQLKRMAIMRACKWSRPTFYNKLNDPGSISPAHQQAIARIYKEDLSILFPGEIFEFEPKKTS